MNNEKHIAEIEGKLIHLRASESCAYSDISRCYDKIEESTVEISKIEEEIKEAERELKLLKEGGE